jgi:hypothetical protein
VTPQEAKNFPGTTTSDEQAVNEIVDLARLALAGGVWLILGPVALYLAISRS